MLICAYLLNDKKAVQRRTEEVETLLMSELGSSQPSSIIPHPSALSPLTSEIACYLTLSLFIMHHDPRLRKQAKLWRQSHPDCSLSLRRFLSLAKQIRC